MTDTEEERLQRIEGTIESVLTILSTDPQRRTSGAAVNQAMIVSSLEHEVRSIDLRHRLMPKVVHKDIAWSLMLVIYRFAHQRKRLSLLGAIQSAHYPNATSWRHLDLLHAADMTQREPDPLDKRRIWVTPTHKATGLLERYFKALRS